MECLPEKQILLFVKLANVIGLAEGAIEEKEKFLKKLFLPNLYVIFLLPSFKTIWNKVK